MRRDVMEHSGLAYFAEIAIIIFFAAFVLILARAIFMSRSEANRMLHMPLDDGIAAGTDGAEVRDQEVRS